jgi:hypothetical protein
VLFLGRVGVSVDLETWSDERIVYYLQRLSAQMPKQDGAKGGTKRVEQMDRSEAAGYTPGRAVRIPGRT